VTFSCAETATAETTAPKRMGKTARMKVSG
jgi:hypothetical protein